MSCGGWVRRLALSAVLSTGLVTAARADRIDGEWCFASSTLAINGPTIRAPGGSVLQGNYDRHGFSYVAPANEPDPGSEVVMRLLNEETMHLMRKGFTQPQTWQRCKVTS